MGIWYRTGTASVANGAAAVTGDGTAWLVYARPGDRITFDNGGKWYEILSVNSNTSITLATNFAETTIAAPGAAYAIDPSSYRHQIPSDILEQLRAVLDGQTNVYEVGGLPSNDFGANDDLAVDFAGLDLYYKAAGSWVGPVPMAYGEAHRYLFATSTAMADPGVGLLRLNNAALASVTAIAVDSQTASPGNPNIETVVREWDDSTTAAHRGILTIRKRSDPAVFAIYRVSGASTENAGWTQLAVTHLASSGSFAANDALAVSFERTGNQGSVSGPGSSVNNRIAVFSGTGGSTLADGGKTIAEIDASIAAKFDSAGGTITGPLLQTGAISPDELTADQNDYAPTGFATAAIVRLTSNNWRKITGLAGGADGRRILLLNAGTNPIILSSENAASAAANRFAAGDGSIVLLAGEQCELRYDGTASRWREITDVGGARKARKLPSNVVNNNASANTLADLTGLAFWMEANRTYEFRIKVAYNAAVTTTGSRWTVNGPTGPTVVSYFSHYTLTVTTQTINYAGSYQQPTASNATSLTTGNLAIIEGIVRNGSTEGLLQAQFASEIANSAITALADASFIEWREVV